jgi:hypothetical protein
MMSDGKMKEPNTFRDDFSDLSPADKKKKGACLLCDYGSIDKRTIAMLRDVHGPKSHTWKGTKNHSRDCAQCKNCGIPIEILKDADSLSTHTQNHELDNAVVYQEVYLDQNNPTGQFNEIKFHPFYVNLSGEFIKKNHMNN